ncbi:N-acetylmuramoyl-L-alanine amidase [Fictibacillus gelatini]|uniref:N-acetylmuramoyl-L-alanine amidase n=1 Tax=Fictibacillus gelatini TaxID=225985 RepID=UPI00041ACADE|nr:N-acetylmuramoyl-L-alanine amidase [Fictibacillus gelatini]
MKKRIAIGIVVAFVLTFAQLPFAEAIAKTNHQVVVTADVLNVRLGPGENYKVIGHLKMGSNVKVISEKGMWAQILYKKKPAWIATGYIRNAVDKPVSKREGVVSASSLNVRNKPSLNSKVLTALTSGTRVTILQEQGNWFMVETGHPIKGWVAKSYVSFQKGVATVSDLNVRALPGIGHRILEKLSKGATVTILMEGQGWSKVKTKAGTVGWVADRYLQAGESKQATEQKRETKRSASNEQQTPAANKRPFEQQKQRRADGAKKKAEQTTGRQNLLNQRSSIAKAPESNSAETLKGKTIVLDPGHGGRDSGAIGDKYKTYEKDITLSTAKLTAEQLKEAGAHVAMTRDSDKYIPLHERAMKSVRASADAFVSIHYNFCEKNACHGLMSFYYSKTKDLPLARSIQQQITQSTDLTNLHVQFGDLQVLRDNRKPAVLVELGFLSNPSEERVIRSRSYQEKAASGIVQGLKAYFQSGKN